MRKVQQRDAGATRRRLLEAARGEFAQYGIAGARVDRIAENASANKAQIYHYFGSKDELFEAVFEQIVEVALKEAPMDPTELPEYAGRLFDGYEEYPDIARLTTWYRLERGDSGEVIQAIVDSYRDKIQAIERAQESGQVARTFAPEVLLGLVMHTAAMWTAQIPEYELENRGMSAEERRSVVVRAIEALV